jgi:hypothetical protein
VITSVIKYYEKPDDNFPTFNQDDYRDVALGSYIETHVFASPRQSKRKGTRSYSDESGTVKDKSRFAELALEGIESEADISTEAKQIGELLYKFIERHNPSTAPR